MKYWYTVMVSILMLGTIPAATAPGATLQDLLARADSLYTQHKTLATLQVLQQAEAMSSNDADVLWRMARAYYDQGVMAPEKQKESSFEQCEQYARKAVQADPQNEKGHLWLAIGVGKVALERGGKEKVDLSREVKEEAEKAIQLNPNDYQPYHVLARWNYEVATLSWVLKAAAKIVYGGLPPASVSESITLFKKAIQLNPTEVNNHLQLAKVYIHEGEKADARAQLQKALSLPNRDIEDPDHKKEARELLDKLGS